MNLLLSLLILAAAPAASIDARYPQAVEVYHNRFDEGADRNFDDWPDDWTRRRGAGFPHYVRVRIAPVADRSGERCLRVDLNGGAVQVQAPPMPIHASSSYVLEVLIKTEALAGDAADVSLTFLDEQKQPLETFHSEPVRQAAQWQKLRLGPLATAHRDARFAVIGLHVTPTERPGLKGSVQFADVWLASLPRMSIETNQPLNLFSSATDVEIRCHLSGFRESDGQLDFELHDALDQPVDRFSQSLDAPPSPSSATAAAAASESSRRAATLRWRPKIAAPGYYRARVAMHAGQRLILQRELSLAVMPARPPAANNEFGWSLPRGADPVPLAALPGLLKQANVGWIKFPLWFSDKQPAKVQELVRFVERMGEQGIEIVGLLDEPPAEVRGTFGNKAELTAAELFTPEPEVWYPSLEPVMTQLSMKVRRWQLGGDDDTSLMGYPELRAKVAVVKQQFNRIGQDMQLGLGWRWLDAVPGDRLPWSFVTLSTDPPLAAHELAAYLSPLADSKTERWVALEPLPRSHYSTATRAADLAHRMLSARQHGATRIFIPQPFDDERGLLHRDGTPSELLCPWQVMAGALSGTQHLGSLQLAGGSRNELFARQDEAVLVVWNNRPTREKVELDSQLQQSDLWGRPIEPSNKQSGVWIEAGPLPTIVRGLNVAVARSAMSIQFADDRFPSVFGVPHATTITLKNPFPRGASGKIRFRLPEGWQIEPEQVEFKLAAGEQVQADVALRFPFDANSGTQSVRIDVEMAADRSYRFSVDRKIQVGLGDITLEATSQLADNGELVVKQRLHNHTDEPVSFRCDLFAAGRRRLRTQVFDLGRGEDVQTYRLPAGRELLGQTLWIRAEELEGARVLSHRFRAEE
jgi:hypothetical protein